MHGPVADQSPAGDGHSFDKVVLSEGVGLEFLDQRCEEFFEARRVFGGEDEDVGKRGTGTNSEPTASLESARYMDEGYYDSQGC